MKKLLYVVLIVNLFAEFLFASAINNIDEDPWLRTWLFVGPFENYETAEKISDSLSRFNIEDIISFTQKSDNIKNYLLSSNSSVGKHSIYQYFFDSREATLKSNERYIIGFSKILSSEKIDALYNQKIHPNDRLTFYLNNQIVVEKSNDWNYSGIINLEKGENRCRLITQLKDEQINFWYGYENSLSIGILNAKYYTRFSGIVSHNGRAVPDANIEVYNKSGFHIETKSNPNGEYEFNLINSMVGDTLDVYVNKDDLKFQKRISRHELDNKNINIALSDYNDTINGKVLTLFEETKQSDILVQLIKIPNGTIQDKAFTDKSGFFSFTRVPKGSYQIFVETAQGKYFYSDKNKNTSDIEIGEKKSYNDKIIINVPQINKGQWEQVTFIKGLRSDMVFDVHIDSRNRIWYGCHTGLSVYDGNMIKNFGAREGLGTGAVVEIFEDSKGLIWILQRNNYMGGGVIFTMDEDYSLSNFNEINDLQFLGVNAIAEDKSGNIIIGGMAGLYIFDGEKIEIFKYGDGLGSGFVTDILVDGDFYWIGTSDGLVGYNGRVFTHYGALEGLIGSNYIKKLSKSKKGNLLISTGENGRFRESSREVFTKSIYEYDGLTFNITNDFNYTPNNADLNFDNNRIIYNSQNKLLINYTDHQQAISPFWSHDKPFGGYITSIDIAKSGSVIIGTLGGGAWKYNGHSAYTISSVDGIGISNMGSGVIDNDGQLWNTSGNQGIIVTKNGEIVKRLNTETGFPTNSLSALAIDNFGNIWATSDIGLINIVGNKFIIHNESSGFMKNSMHNISINENGLIWVSGWDFLSSMNGKLITNYQSDVDSIKITGGNSGLLALADGSVLFGGQGLKKLIPDKKGGKFYFLEKSDHCNAIAKDKSGNYIYSSVSEGLVKLDPQGKKEVFNLDTGFKYEVPLTAYVDKNGWFWSSSESGGVALFDGAVWSFLTTDDGLLSNWVSSITSGSNGSYYFTHLEGITVYKPLKLAGHVEVNKISTSLTDYKMDDYIESIVKERI